MPRFLITAGPTREPIDAVRFVGNRSSGKMGLAIAQAAHEAGHEVTLLLGPIGETAALPQGVRVYRFESSTELKQLLEAHFSDCDLLIMAAAVADYRPSVVQEGKVRVDHTQSITLRLDPTPDLVALTAASKRANQKVIAFALEEAQQLEARAIEKMRQKKVDAIVANPLGTMEADAVTACLYYANGTQSAPGRLSKREFARWLVAKIA